MNPHPYDIAPIMITMKQQLPWGEFLQGNFRNGIQVINSYEQYFADVLHTARKEITGRDDGNLYKYATEMKQILEAEAQILSSEYNTIDQQFKEYTSKKKDLYKNILNGYDDTKRKDFCLWLKKLKKQSSYKDLLTRLESERKVQWVNGLRTYNDDITAVIDLNVKIGQLQSKKRTIRIKQKGPCRFNDSIAQRLAYVEPSNLYEKVIRLYAQLIEDIFGGYWLPSIIESREGLWYEFLATYLLLDPHTISAYRNYLIRNHPNKKVLFSYVGDKVSMYGVDGSLNDVKQNIEDIVDTHVYNKHRRVKKGKNEKYEPHLSEKRELFLQLLTHSERDIVWQEAKIRYPILHELMNDTHGADSEYSEFETEMSTIRNSEYYGRITQDKPLKLLSDIFVAMSPQEQKEIHNSYWKNMDRYESMLQLCKKTILPTLF
ncbi:MAG TPA: hypothetical protein PLW93_00795 [Candidatus Absconditabacterales bacterium]|nr:hypothetical protein [Candidatus Absconditabacterales bacterium]HNG96788.1 hypothetical protein [Candidatus Absconditabacterales bacterium]